MKKILYLLLLPAIMSVSCNSSKNVVYLQDLVPNQTEVIANLNEIKIQPRDQISITVSCREPEIANLFNLVTAQRTMMPSGVQYNSGQGIMSVYTVSADGTIDFPVVGDISVSGLTRTQIAAKIKDRLVSDDLVKDPVVTVEFINLHFAVMGEVARPGSYNINNDRVTLLDALSQAGDLTIYGKRDRVSVIREQDGRRMTYTVDLRSRDLFDSPVYYLQQNDVIYVEPNNARAGQSTINENNWKSAGLWVSIASLLTSVAVLVFK